MCIWHFFSEKVELRWSKCFLTNPSGNGQKEVPLQGSLSHLPDTYLRTRKITCWSCLFLFTDSMGSQRTNFNQMSHFWKGAKERQQESLLDFTSPASYLQGRWKKSSLKICVYMLETYILTVSNVIKKFRRSVLERSLVTLVQSRNIQWQPIDKTTLAMYWFTVILTEL